MDEYGNDYYMTHFVFDKLPRSAPPVVKAEQTKPDSRAARRQTKREQDRKWKIKYAESEGEE